MMMLQIDNPPLTDAATRDSRLRPFDVCVLVRAMKMLSYTHALPLKLSAIAVDVVTSRGRPASRSSVYRSIVRLCATGYLIRGPKQGLGGTGTYRLPRPPGTR